MTEPTVYAGVETSIPSPTKAKHSPSKQGKGAKQAQELRFRQKKNEQFQTQLKESIMARLKIKDPTNVSTVKLTSAVIPSRVPVSLRAIPTLLKELWERMLAIGTRPFGTIAQDPNNRAIFYKVSLLLFEAKVCWAQRQVSNRPRFDLPSQFTFTDMVLRKINSVAKKLPMPLAVALESLGNYTVGKQQVIPVFLKTNPLAASGAVNFARSELKKLVRALAAPVAPDNIILAVARELDCLPNIRWVTNHDGTVQLAPESVEFWSGDDYLPPHEREVYLKIIASMESKKGFLLMIDLDHGDGSAVPSIRYPDAYDPDETESLYYTNVETSSFDEQLSLALMYGFEYRGDKFSRFCGEYDEPYLHGSGCAAEVRRALIWADNE